MSNVTATAICSKEKPPRRVLLVRNDRIGDLLLTLPAFDAARRCWPAAHLTALVSPYAGPLIVNHPSLNEVIFDVPDESPWRLGRRLHRMRFDAAIVFNTGTRNCLAVWSARIRRRVCWAYKPVGWLTATHRVRLHRSHPPVHEAAFALAFVRQLGVTSEAGERLPQLHIERSIRDRTCARIRDTLGSDGPLFGVHPGNKHSAYNWPIEHYFELVRGLAHRGRVMVTGSPAEGPLLDSIRRGLTETERSRTGFFTDLQLPELAAAIAEQDVLVVSSTGPMHLAGVVGTPTVALFSPHPAHVPAKWAPLGTNHTLLVAPLLPGEDAKVPRDRGTELMARIGVERVLQAALAQVSGASSAAA